MSEWTRIGLALGGGGARGLAHLGVLWALEKEKIPLRMLSGTSIGALIAASYAMTPRIDKVIERFRQYLESKPFLKTNPEFLYDHPEPLSKFQGIFHRFATLIKKGIFYTQSLTKRAAISEESFSQNINFLLDDDRIENAQIPLAIVALDLNAGEEVVLRCGSLRKAVSASCAIPGILPPVKIDDRELVDGGWINRVPVSPLKAMGADLIIAVDVADSADEGEDLMTGLGIVMRTNEICRCALSRLQLKDADLIIRPDVSRVHWADFRRLDDCLEAGHKAMIEKIPELRRMIRKKKFRKIISIPFPFLKS
jgi:NTE family protein